MAVTPHNVAGFPPPPPGSSHLSVARGESIVHIAGQTGTDESGNVLEGLAAQAERAFLRVAEALDEAGASEKDLVKLTIYVVGWEPSMLGELVAGGEAARKSRSFPDVPMTLLGVASLFTPDMLVEVEAVAVMEA